MTRIKKYFVNASVITASVMISAANAAVPNEEGTVGALPDRTLDLRADQSISDGAVRALQNYKSFLDVSVETAASRPEAMRRLADLRLEAGELSRGNQESESLSNPDIQEAIALYQKIIKDYPTYIRLDEVLYQLARAYDAEQNSEEVIRLLDQLASQFPKSRLYPEAKFRLGEIYFTDERWHDAELAYTAVIDFGGRSEFYEQSLYKHGWVRFKRSEYSESLTSFAKLLDHSLGDAEDSDKALEQLDRLQRVLVEDTLRVVSVIFSFDDGVVGIEEFAKQEGKKKYDALLYRELGQWYESQERWNDAADVYSAFGRVFPDAVAAPKLMYAAIEAYRRGGFNSSVMDAKRAFADQYAPESPFWQQHPDLRGGEAYLSLKNSIKELAANYHAKAQQSRSAADYAEAATWYRRFMDSFLSEPDAAQTDYNFAESLYESGQYEEAIREYQRVAYELPAGERSADAGRAALSAFELREAEITDETKMAWHEASLNEYIKFATRFGSHKDAEAVLVKAMHGWSDIKRNTEASAVAELLLKRGDGIKPQERQNALVIIANNQFEQQQYKKAEEGYQRVLEVMPHGDKLYADMREKLAAAIYKQAEQSQAAGNQEDALSAFQRIASVSPKSTIRETADYDATTILFQQKAWPQAIEALEQFRKDFPKSERQSEITRRLADAYVADSRWRLAAQEYERMSAAPGIEKQIQLAAIVTANEYFEKANDMDSVRRGLELIIKRFDDQFDQSIEARQKLADFAKQKGDSKTRNKWLNEIVKADRDAGDARTARSRSLAGHAALELTMPMLDSFIALEYNFTQKKSMEVKTKALAAAVEALSALRSYSIADITAASNYHLGEMYRQMAKSLINAPLPKGLPDEVREEFSIKIFEQSVIPYDDKAIQLYMANADLIAKGINDDSTRKSIAAIYQMAEMYRQMAKELEIKAEEDVLVEERLSKYEEQSIKIHMANVTLAAKGVYDDSIRSSYTALAVLNPARFAKTEQVLDFYEPGVPKIEEGQQPIITPKPNDKVLAAINTARTLDASLAADGLKKISTELPEDKLAQVNYGIALVRLARYEDAKAVLSGCCAEVDELLRANATLGLAQSERGLGHFAEARSAYEQALSINPNNVIAHRNFGVLLDLYIQEPTSALPHYERALELSAPADPTLTKWVKEIKQRIAPTARVESEAIIEGQDTVEASEQPQVQLSSESQEEVGQILTASEDAANKQDSAPVEDGVNKSEGAL